MGDKSAIEWTDATWNPVTGCSKVSSGCAHCYAETLALTRMAGKAGYPGLPWTPENAAENVVLRAERIDQPLRWKRPRMVFVNSMSDLFHELIPDRFVAEVFGVMALAEQHTFQVLTKRPERMRTLLNDPMWWAVVEGSAQRIWAERHHGQDPSMWLAVHGPLKNVWLGTSIENRHFVGRADELRATPAAVRFISAEPLLGPLVRPTDGVGCACGWPLDPCSPKFAKGGPCDRIAQEGPHLDLTGIDWLIAGGESGPEHRRMGLGWVRDLRDACVWPTDHGRENEVRFFYKQFGGRTPKAGGRELDGRTWDEMPEVPQ